MEKESISPNENNLKQIDFDDISFLQEIFIDFIKKGLIDGNRTSNDIPFNDIFSSLKDKYEVSNEFQLLNNSGVRENIRSAYISACNCININSQLGDNLKNIDK